MEAKAETPRARMYILQRFDDAGFWYLPIVKTTIAERIVQRYAMAGGDENLLSCARLLRAAPDRPSVNLVLAGLEKAFAGRAATKFPEELKQAVAHALQYDTTGQHLALGVRVGHPGALTAALAVIADEAANKDRRTEFIRMFGEVPQPASVPALLKVLRGSQFHSVRLAALTALQRYDSPDIATTVLELYGGHWQKEAELRSAAQTLLASRPAWSLALLQAIDAGRISPRSLPLDVVRTLQRHSQAAIAKLVEKHWGKVQAATPEA